MHQSTTNRSFRRSCSLLYPGALKEALARKVTWIKPFARKLKFKEDPGAICHLQVLVLIQLERPLGPAASCCYCPL